MGALHAEPEIFDNPDGSKTYYIDRGELEDVLGHEARGDFAALGWSYEKKPSNTCICLRCGGDRFIVGQSREALLTVLKCPNCGWERCVHEG